MEKVTRNKIKRMKQLILEQKTQLLKPEVIVQRELDAQPQIHFGHSLVSCYSKHNRLPIRGVIYNPNMKAFVSYNAKQIHVWSELSGASLFKVDFQQETKSHNVAAMAYSVKY
jgi:hypothetical protein